MIAYIPQKARNKKWLIGLALQGQLNLAKNAQNTPLMTTSTDNPKRFNFFFFSIETVRLAESAEGLISSLVLAAGKLWPRKYRPSLWLARALKSAIKSKHFSNALRDSSVYISVFQPGFRGIPGFRERPGVPLNRAKVPGTKSASTVLCGCSSTSVSQLQRVP